MIGDLVAPAVAVLIAAAVVLWPTGRNPGRAGRAGLTTGVGPRRLDPGSAPPARHGGSVGPPDPGYPGYPGYPERRPPRRWLAWRPGAGRRERDAGVAAVLEVLDALSPALAAGLTPRGALAGIEPSTAAGRALVGHLADAVVDGDPLATIWRDQARRLGSVEIALVASAWSLCEELGSPLSSTVASVARVLRQRIAVQRRVDVVLAGPRATVLVLSLLPAAGPVVAVLLGIPVSELYASPAALTAVGAGLGLLALGWWWSHRLVHSVTTARPTTLSGW